MLETKIQKEIIYELQNNSETKQKVLKQLILYLVEQKDKGKNYIDFKRIINELEENDEMKAIKDITNKN